MEKSESELIPSNINTSKFLLPNPVNQCTLNKPKFYVLIYNLSKPKNIGTLIRSAAAFGCHQIFILGSDKKILKKFFGSQGTVEKSEFVFFDNVEQLKTHCTKNNIEFCGIEIGKSSKPIHKYPFKSDTLFVLGNEGTGFNNKQKELCGENLAYIPQYSNKTASLNVAVAASIIFNHFSLWAGYEEVEFNEMNEEKFDVDKNLKKEVIFYNDLEKNSNSDIDLIEDNKRI